MFRASDAGSPRSKGTTKRPSGLVAPRCLNGHLHPLSKLVLTGAMWIGRLEILTVLALLRPEVWRSAHWRPKARA